MSATQHKQELKTDTEHLGPFYSPNVNIYDADDAIILEADIPGVTKERVDIDIKDNTLSLTGYFEDKKRTANYWEYAVGGYFRKFTIGNKIRKNDITAKLADGVLTLTLPKEQAPKPRKIQVAAA